MATITTIVFTGTNGIRMRPLALDKSKTILPFMGKPLLQHTVNTLKCAGFTDLIFTSSGRNGEIREYFSAGEAFGVHIRYHDGGSWRETAGTTRDVLETIKGEVSDPFMVVYGDSVIQADYEGMLRFHLENRSDCTVLYHEPDFEAFVYAYHDQQMENQGIRTGFGVMGLDNGGRVTLYTEKPLMADVKERFENPVSNAGVFLLTKSLMDCVPDHGTFDFSRDLLPRLLEEGASCFGFDIADGYRLDVGTLRNYYMAQMAALKGTLAFDIDFPLVRDGVWIGRGSMVASWEEIEKPVLICENTTIGPETHVEGSIIGNKVRVGESSNITGSIVLDGVYIGDNTTISNSIVSENAVIEDDTAVPPYTALGSYCRLGGSDHIMKEADFLGLIRKW